MSKGWRDTQTEEGEKKIDWTIKEGSWWTGMCPGWKVFTPLKNEGLFISEWKWFLTPFLKASFEIKTQED